MGSFAVEDLADAAQSRGGPVVADGFQQAQAPRRIAMDGGVGQGAGAQPPAPDPPLVVGPIPFGGASAVVALIGGVVWIQTAQAEGGEKGVGQGDRKELIGPQRLLGATVGPVEHVEHVETETGRRVPEARKVA